MDVFLSHSAADTKLAERLTRGLERHGLSVWFDGRELSPGSDWRHEIEDAIRSARNVVLLIDRQPRPDNVQEFTWQAALEAAWQDERKRLIPVLRRGAELPGFVLSGSSGNDVPVVRIEDARALRDVVEDIVELADGAATRSRRPRAYRDASGPEAGRSFAIRSVVFDEPDHKSPPKTDNRQKRLDEIERYARALK